jgi:hypothetical protein
VNIVRGGILLRKMPLGANGSEKCRLEAAELEKAFDHESFQSQLLAEIQANESPFK